jgi:hypothetical protein
MVFIADGYVPVGEMYLKPWDAIDFAAMPENQR